MARLSLFGAICLAALLSACASAPSSTAQTLQTTGTSPYRHYWREGDPVFVRVQASSADALLLAEPDPWAEPLALLEYGQPLTVLDESHGNYISVRTRGLGVEIEGWVMRGTVGIRAPLLSELEQHELERTGFESAPDATAPSVEGRPTEDGRDDLARGLARLDEHEADLNRLRGGDALNPDPAITRARFRAFGEQGGLLGD